MTLNEHLLNAKTYGTTLAYEIVSTHMTNLHARVDATTEGTAILQELINDVKFIVR